MKCSNGQLAPTDARDPGECRRNTEHQHASAVGFLVAGVERLAVAIESLNTDLEQIASSDPSCVRLQ